MKVNYLLKIFLYKKKDSSPTQKNSISLLNITSPTMKVSSQTTNSLITTNTGCLSTINISISSTKSPFPKSKFFSSELKVCKLKRKKPKLLNKF